MIFGKNKNDKRRVVANEIKELEDGTMEVTITFDPFYHGHDLGKPRNYDPKKYKAMVESKSTQTRIKNGYAVGYYSHESRNKKRGYIPSERDTEGKEVIPCCKTLSMEWTEDGKVRHTQRILNNSIGKEIQTLIKGGVGGFSSVHNLATKEFLGFDYVVAPNFSSNRAVVDNACNNGVCGLDLDSIEHQILEDTKSNIENYLQNMGIDSIEIRDALLRLEEQTADISSAKKILEKMKLYEDTIADLREQHRLELEAKEIELEDVKDELDLLKEELDAVRQGKIQEVEELKTKLDSLGLDDELKPQDWGKYIQYTTTDDIIADQRVELDKHKDKINKNTMLEKQLKKFNFALMKPYSTK
jgi:hypothetical protein